MVLRADCLKKPTEESRRAAAEKLLKSSIKRNRGSRVLDIFYNTRIEQLKLFRRDMYRNENYVFYDFSKKICEIDDVKEYEMIGVDFFDITL